MFDFSKWENRLVAMHCKSEKEAKLFCEEMDKFGLSWDNGKSYIEEDCWGNFKENTVYYFNEGLLGRLRFVPGKYKILEYSDYILSKKEIKLCELLEKGYISRFLDNSLVWSEESPKMGSDLYIIKGDTLDIIEFANELNIEELNFNFVKKGEIYKVEEILRMVGE